MSEYVVREATAADCGEIARLIRDLAVYEHLEDQVKLTESQLREDGFGPTQYFRCLVTQSLSPNGEPHKDASKLVGYALFFNKYSTFEGRSIYLEDLYVSPEHRKQGLGSQMLKKIAQIGVSERCVRLDFAVLAWNANSIAFYKSRGAVNLTETEQWNMFRFYVNEMKELAKRDVPCKANIYFT